MVKKLKNNILFITIILNFLLIILLFSYNFIEEIYENSIINKYFQTKINNVIIDNNILEIPKINLKQPFFDINDKNNNVNKNIELLNNSVLPTENNSILAFAAHSGNGKKAFFKNLNKLNKDDLIYIYIQNNIYTYKIIDIYEEIRNGYLNILKENNLLILTTCSKNNKQLVIIAKQIKKSFK